MRPDGPAILVDRGWVPADQAHPGRAPPGPARGRGRGHRHRALPRATTGPAGSRPTTSPSRRLWYSYDLPALEAAVGLELLPVVVEADATPNPGGLPQGGRTSLDLPNNHLQYAITWYGLAAALLAIYARVQPGAEPPAMSGAAPGRGRRARADLRA